MNLDPPEIPGYRVVEPFECIQTNLSVTFKYQRVGGGGFVAIKFPLYRGNFSVSDGHQNDTESLLEFRREIQFLKCISSTDVHIVHYVNDSEIMWDLNQPQFKIPYLITKWINGGTLDKWVVQGRKLPERVTVMRNMISSVAGLHEKGVIHNDLKVNQIMVNERGQPLLLDFGRAKVTPMPGSIDGFTAPELYDPDPTNSFHIDVYSLGVILYLTLSDRPKELMEAYFAELNSRNTRGYLDIQNLGPVKSACSNLSTSLQKVISRCLSEDTSKRYRNAEMLLKAVDEAEGSQQRDKQASSWPVWILIPGIALCIGILFKIWMP